MVLLARELGGAIVRLGFIALVTLSPAGIVAMAAPSLVRSIPGGAATLFGVAFALFFAVAVLLLVRRIRLLRWLLASGAEVEGRLIGVNAPKAWGGYSDWVATYSFSSGGEVHYLVTRSLVRAMAVLHGEHVTILVDPGDPSRNVLLRGEPGALGRMLRQIAAATGWQWAVAAAGIPAAMAAGLALPTLSPGWIALTVLAALAAFLRAIDHGRRALGSATPMPSRVSALIAASLASALGLLLCLALTAISVLAR